MDEEEQQSVKRMKLENSANQLHISEDLSSPNTKFSVSIFHKLYLDGTTADIHFLLFETNDSNDIEPERIPAHKLILSTGSKVFNTMFHGSLPAGNEVKISNVNLSSFKVFLQFFYLDEVKLTTDNITEVMNLVQQYGIERCMVECIDFINDTVTSEDICSAYQLGVQFELDDLKHFCQRKISANAEDVLKSNDFLNCDHKLLQLIVNMDSLICNEVNVFDGCVAWAKNLCEKNDLNLYKGTNLREQLGESVLYSIHFNRMELADFARRNKNARIGRDCASHCMYGIQTKFVHGKTNLLRSIYL